ncbi:FG-GAP repeat domain-containing protein [Oceaniglobus trochenteri]|uniref:FG-GAP repeat domain-containing protein n=1 Tax=Oceaniglobus trochenteri TaxID=2763260 RepID=UPI001D001511|nr:VCBS repeat-containing protein [Oceaniglobus trochenteri]
MISARALIAWALPALFAGQGLAAEITAARYTDPTDRYPHAVLGDGIEHATLEVTLSDGRRLSAQYPPGMVFEDTAPRLADVTGDGAPEVITVESSDSQGARLAVWGLDGQGRLAPLAASPFIGQRFRWLAPVGAADLDGDGRIELAWIDRPHLAKTLMVWRMEPAGEGWRLVPLAESPGLTNHRIGESDIAGGMRDCGAGPEMITADAAWRNVMATRLAGGRLTSRVIGRHRDRGSFAAAMACD